VVELEAQAAVGEGAAHLLDHGPTGIGPPPQVVVGHLVDLDLALDPHER